jgi:hypothetical protein
MAAVAMELAVRTIFVRVFPDGMLVLQIAASVVVPLDPLGLINLMTQTRLIYLQLVAMLVFVTTNLDNVNVLKDSLVVLVNAAGVQITATVMERALALLICRTIMVLTTYRTRIPLQSVMVWA